MKTPLLCALLLAATTASPQPHAWTLQECIQHALNHNIELKQQEQERELQRIELSTAKNSWLPNLNASLGQNFDFGRSPSKDGIIVDQNSANSSAYLQASMPLFDGFRTPNNIAAQKLNLDAATAALDKAKDNLSVNVASAFLQTLYNKEILHIAELQVSLTAEQVTKTEALVTAGKAPLSQLYDIQAQLANDEVSLTQARNNVQLALLELAQLLELERTGTAFDIALPPHDTLIAETMGALLPPDIIYQNALPVKPQIKEQELLLQRRQKLLKVAQSAYYPSLNLNLSYSNGYYRYFGQQASANVPFPDQLNQNERKTIALALSIPIFSRFEIRNSVRSAHVAILTQELLIENTKKNLYKEIQQAYYNALSAKDKYHAAKKSVQATQQAFHYAQERYATGKNSVFEYSEAKNKYAQSLAQQAQAKYDYLFRAKILDFYNGQPLNL